MEATLGYAMADAMTSNGWILKKMTVASQYHHPAQP